MRDFPLDERMRRLLITPEVGEWRNIEGGAAPAWNDDRQLIYRFWEDADGNRFEARWLSH